MMRMRNSSPSRLHLTVAAPGVLACVFWLAVQAHAAELAGNPAVGGAAGTNAQTTVLPSSPPSKTNGVGTNDSPNNNSSVIRTGGGNLSTTNGLTDERSARNGSRSRGEMSGAAMARIPAANARGSLASAPKASASKRDLSSFKIIMERNIFDPNRRSRTRAGVSEQPKPASVDSFSLVGTMSYEKGKFAFFDGTGFEYRKAAKAGDTLAGFRVKEIGPKAVKLEANGKVLDLGVGMQMRRQDAGEWQMTGRSDTYASAAPSDRSSASSGSESELLKRLMQQREKELKP